MTQKMLQQNLRSQIQKVCRLVKNQQIGIVKQQTGQFHTSLPASRQFFHRPFQVMTFDLKLGSHLATLPVGSTRISHQKIESRFPRQKWIVLLKISHSQRRMFDDFPSVQIFLAQQNPAKSRLPRSVPPDKTDLFIGFQSQAGMIKNRLRAVSFTGFLKLKQYRHGLNLVR